MTLEKYQSVFLGCAIGDALGMPVEGWKPGRIKKVLGRVTQFMDHIILYDEHGNELQRDEFGKLGYYSRGLTAGQYTDDTILTIALAESLIACKGIDFEDIAQRQLAEYTKRLREDGTVIGGSEGCGLRTCSAASFGGTTIAGFKNLLEGKSYQESGVIGGPGNAPAMKMSPLGLYMDIVQEKEGIEECLKTALAIGRITHLDPRSLASGVVQAHAIYGLLNGNDRKEFVQAAQSLCRRFEDEITPEFSLAEEGSLLQRLNWIFAHRDASPDQAYAEIRPSSKVYGSYPFALFMFQKYWDDPVEGLLATVNYGGDCDTTGAIFGALAGARHGLCWPKEWVKQVQDARKLKKLGRRMWEIKK